MTGRWRELVARFLRLGRAHQAYEELDAEFESHRQMAVDEYLRSGHSPEEARRLAAVRFGSPLAARERVDDQRSIPSLENCLVDVRYALRSLRRTPGFSALGVVVLGLGIAVNLAVFTVANATLFRGFRGIPDQDRVVYVTSGRGCCLSYLDLQDWQANTKSFTGIEAVADQRVSLEIGPVVETATATEVSAGLFSLLKVAPILGRDFVGADDAPGASRVAIVSHDFWRSHFNASSSALGTVIKANGTPVTVIGVMPEHFVFPQRQDLWMPLGPRVSGQPRNSRGLWLAVARLRDGVTIQQAQEEMQSVGARLAITYPATNTGVSPSVQTFSQFFVGPDADVVYGSLWAGVSVLLLIACVNLVNLLLARTAGRSRETGVRLALGAGRMRIVRLHVFESVLLALGGGLLSWWLAPLLLAVYAGVAVPPTQPWSAQLFDYSIDIHAAGYLAILVLLTGVATGLVPAWRASRIAVQSVLRDGGRGTVGRARQRRLTNGIVIVQVGLAVVLLSASGLLLRSVINVENRRLGYDPTRVLVALSSLPETSYPDAESQFRFFDRVASGIRSIPGIDAVALVDGVAGQRSGTTGVEIEGQPFTTASETREVRQSSISDGYFSAMGARLVAGRDFSNRDDSSSPAVIIVNRRFANMYWQTDDVIGRRTRVHAGPKVGPWLLVVGLAPDLHQGDVTHADADPTVYRPMLQRPGRGAWFVAHTSTAAPQSLIAPIRQQIQMADPTVPIWLGPYTLDEWTAGQYWKRAVNGGLFSVFAMLALLLVGLGLLAVSLATVAARRQEISVRIALGAGAIDILRLVMRQGLEPAIAGLAAGVIVSLGTNQLLASQLVDVGAWDPTVLAAVAAVILFATLLGCLAPAVQATRLDPLQAMRGD